MTRPSGREVFVGGQMRPMKILSVTSNKASSRLEAVSSGPNTRKLLDGCVQLHDVAKKLPKTRVASEVTVPGLGDLDLIVAKIRHDQIFQQQSAIGVRIRAHSARALRARVPPVPESACHSDRTVPRAGSFSSTLPALPMRSGLLARSDKRHLVRAPGSFDRLAVHYLRGRSSPSVCASRSSATRGESLTAGVRRVCLNSADFFEDRVQCGGHQLMHGRRIVALRQNTGCNHSR